ncbi:MAG: hypothetical protein MJ221_02575 [Bacilli bacterium]|nr:hypothetical protein [Bacilli bacterium]
MKREQFIFLNSSVSKSNKNIQIDTDNFINELDLKTIKFNNKVFFIQSGGTEEIFIKIYKKYKPPYYLIATDSNNSLPASLEIVSFLRSKKLECYLFHGKAKDVRESLNSQYQNKIHFNYELNPEIKLLENVKLGVIGEPSDWLIASKVNYEEVNYVFGASIVDISFEEFKNEIEKSKVSSIGKYKNYLTDKIKEEDIIVALKIYKALKRIADKYSLNGLSVRCFDLLGTIHSTSCLALAMLNDEGIISSCEGDIPALLTMMIVFKHFGKHSFQCNPSYINVDQNYGYFAHCTLPLKMTSSFSLNTHFESNIGVGIHGELKTGNVTICKINADLKKFSVFAGKINENLYKNNLCRTQIKVSFIDPIDTVLSSPCGNHLIIFYGNYCSKFVSLLTSKLS